MDEKLLPGQSSIHPGPCSRQNTIRQPASRESMQRSTGDNFERLMLRMFDGYLHGKIDDP